MTINAIASVINYKNKLAIGINNSLVVSLKNDLLFFKNITSNNITSNNISTNSKINRNVVLMGRKTWFSISNDKRPLANRINLVLTNDKELLKTSPYKKGCKLDKLKNHYFITWDDFLDFYKRTCANVFVIGGAEIYNLFFNNLNTALNPSKVYLTEVYDYKVENNMEPNVFIEPLSQNYKLISVSDKKHDHLYNVHYRFLQYKYVPGYITDEYKYINLIKYIFSNGNERLDRTGVGTLSSFGHRMEFDISQTIPLLTTRKVAWKAIVEELLFFCRGDTDASVLKNRGVKIWDGNTSREFLDARGLHNYKSGIMGPMYGWMWRFYGAKYSQAFADTSNIDTQKIGGFDQLAHVENLLKTDPFSRRIYITNLNPSQTANMVLETCHVYLQFYVEQRGNQKYLSGYFTMRSSDSLAWCYNIISYSILIYILALRCNMKPCKIIYNSVDCHIYKNHFSQLQEQLKRTPRSLPMLILDPSLKHKDWSEMQFNDFDLVGYFPHPIIKMPMAV